jgi:voltage-gated sodium channel
MVKTCKAIAESRAFINFIIAAIVAAGVLVGVQTYQGVVDSHGPMLTILDKVILWIFAIEAFIKIAAEGRQPQRYFKDPWNLFDFLIVAVCFMEPILPINAAFLPVLRLVRVLRVLKLVTAIPQLQLLVGALLRSIPSMGYIGVLLGLLFYMYATMAVFLFRDNDPVHFATLHLAMLSLFRVATLEDWTDIMYINMYGSENYGYEGMQHLIVQSSASPVLAAMFFSSFVVLGTMIILNLFIGVIMNSMDEARQENALQEMAERKADGGGPTVSDEIFLINEQLDSVKELLALVEHRMGDLAMVRVRDDA